MSSLLVTECTGDKLTVASKRLCVMFLPNSTDARTHLGDGVALLVEPTCFTSCGSETPQLTVLHDWLADPVGLRVPSDSLVERINHNNFIILVTRILIHPIRVENSQVSALPTSSLLCNTALVTLELEFRDTLMLRLSVLNTL